MVRSRNWLLRLERVDQHGSPLRPTNARSVDQGRSDRVEKRDSHQGGPPEDPIAKENSTVDELARSEERLGQGSLGRRPADSRQERDPRFTLTRSGRADAAAQAQERCGPLGRGVWPTGHPPDQHLP
jgi:hypothetical protein